MWHSFNSSKCLEWPEKAPPPQLHLNLFQVEQSSEHWFHPSWLQADYTTLSPRDHLAPLLQPTWRQCDTEFYLDLCSQLSIMMQKSCILCLFIYQSLRTATHYSPLSQSSLGVFCNCMKSQVIPSSPGFLVYMTIQFSQCQRLIASAVQKWESKGEEKPKQSFQPWVFFHKHPLPFLWSWSLHSFLGSCRESCDTK